jgi:hypothetical protein
MLACGPEDHGSGFDAGFDAAIVAADSRSDASSDPDRPADLAAPDRPTDVAPDVTPDRPGDTTPDGPGYVPPDVPPDAAEAAPACGSGKVRLAFYSTPDLSGQPVLERSERGLNFDWADGSPGPGVPDYFSILIGATITPMVTGDYTLFLDVDDGARLWLDGELVIDWWRGSPGVVLAAKVHLTAGQRHQLSIEYHEANGLANLALTWQRGSGAPEVIPDCVLDEAPPRKSACPQAIEVDCVPEPAPLCAGGQGLRTSYSRSGTFTPADHVEDATGFTFDWSWLDETARRSEVWNTRWEGTLLVPKTDTYTFALISEGAAELTIAGQSARVVNDETRIRPEATATVFLEAGRGYPVRLTHTDRFAAAWSFIQVRWKSASIPKGVIPLCFLTYP